MKTYDSFRGDAKVSVWLCQIAKHLWYKEYKRSSSHTSDLWRISSDLIPLRKLCGAEGCGKRCETEDVSETAEADEKTREVMYLRLTGELSFREIGEILEKNETWHGSPSIEGSRKS